MSLKPPTWTSAHICSPQFAVVGEKRKVKSPSVDPPPLFPVSQLIVRFPLMNSGATKLFWLSTTSIEVGVPEKTIGKLSIAVSILSKQI